MAKKIKPLADAPELPKEVAGPIEPEDVIELNGDIDGPIDDKLADLMEEAVEKSQSVGTEDLEPDNGDEQEDQNSASEDLEETEELPKPKQSKKKYVNKDLSDEVIDNELSDEEADGFMDDPVTNKAIDEIIAKESDDLLEAQDKEREDEEEKKPHKNSSPVAEFLKSLWTNPRRRWWTIAVTSLVIIALGLIPATRYFILNTTGVRSGLSLRVIDSGTLQPLKNVQVSAGGAAAVTDSQGVAHLKDVRLGSTTLKIEKRAFSNYQKKITVGWGSNPLGDYQVTAVGSQYVFVIKDAFTGEPLANAEAASGDGNAHADPEGKLVLTLDTAELDDSDQISVQISADSYRTETVNITANNRESQQVQMVPGRRHVFVSKRSGKYDVYAVDVDGKNEKKLVGGTGYERDNIVLLPHPTDNKVAYIASRENTRNSSGYLLNTLYIINSQDGDIMRVDQSEEIRIVGWQDGRLIYGKIVSGASGNDPKRHRLMSFDENSDTNKEIASSNYFNDIVLAGGRIYFAPSNYFGESDPAVYSISATGEDRKTILEKEGYNIVRNKYDELRVNAGKDWYDYTLGSPTASKGEEPSNKTSRVYAENPSGNYGLWVDQRDGKGTLLGRSKSDSKEKKITERGGLRLPLYWLNDKYFVFRVSDGRETADYIMNIDGGEARKITDVTNTSGLDYWNKN